MQEQDPNSEKSGIWVSGSTGTAFRFRKQQGGKIRLLVVDDHPGYRRSLRSTFELEPDLDVVGDASSGDEALEQVALLKPDVVLMDVNMPGMDGMEATRKLSD